MLCCWECGRSISGGILCAPCKAIEAAEIEASKPIDWQSRALTAEAEVERLRAALSQARDWFHQYGTSHTAKGDTEKAARNFERATFCENSRSKP